MDGRHRRRVSHYYTIGLTCSAQSTTSLGSTTTEISTPEEDQSTSESTLSSTESTTTRVDKVPTTTAVKTPPAGQWRLRSVKYGKYLRANNGSVDLAEAGEDFEQWDIQERRLNDFVSQFELKSMNNPSDLLYLRASWDRLPKASSNEKLSVNLTNVHEAYERWGATENDDNSWSFMSHNLRWLSTNGTNVYTRILTKPSISEKFVLENL
ncbi:hypothetical protein PRIPAC_70736 [Pristionchus pacificus]|uniref:Uncharacterized protein n=1 Tax=Pristionchus pacificus TaxID=54126 RepID=A0A2A6BEP9_PRIPA|nr:hypothetical protein PRIPAC_70736 [Pristionchus pacificus]|eukprot:PDM64336.1 hypothetical protein PRIPAC_52592 [Pristionchus pacificus]